MRAGGRRSPDRRRPRRFFDLHGAIRPAPAVPIPIIVGGRSDAALRRAGRLGDGWLALWVSPERFARGTELVHATAAEAKRTEVHWRHALQLWAAFDTSAANARERISATMRAAYGLPFERFERYVPCGPPDAVAEALAPYLRLRCRQFNFVAEAPTLPYAMEAVAEVKALLSDAVP
jgi:alkanesulfonate monooxygenase SsuD/methylene tetrahydromethanopterin reductase-like flavin-dependent oxidoreductase (luciferase family)